MLRYFLIHVKMISKWYDWYIWAGHSDTSCTKNITFVLRGRRVESAESFAIHFKIVCCALRRQHLVK
jgi:hypothetical protein